MNSVMNFQVSKITGVSLNNWVSVRFSELTLVLGISYVYQTLPFILGKWYAHEEY